MIIENRISEHSTNEGFILKALDEGKEDDSMNYFSRNVIVKSDSFVETEDIISTLNVIDYENEVVNKNCLKGENRIIKAVEIGQI